MDTYFMKKAIELAKKGEGHTNPNPMVGCVIVKSGKIIAEGYHEKYGEFHAERNALRQCQTSPAGATLYVTLEPCCHYGKTPPCTEAIIEHKIKRVVVGVVDKNPLVGGAGIDFLRKKGVQVTTGVLEPECRKLNEIFFHFIEYKQPYTALKYAATLDGNISTHNGDSKWITEKKAREHVHRLRRKYRGIMVGIGTVLKDDPMLDCRIADGRNPVRIICDSKLRLPLASNIVKTAKEISTIVAYAEDSKQRKKELEQQGLRCVHMPDGRGVDLSALMKFLGKEGIDSLLVEGGGILNGAMLEAGLIHKVYAYLAPKLIGGSGKHPIAGSGVELMNQAYKLEEIRMKQLGNDYLIEGNLKRREC